MIQCLPISNKGLKDDFLIFSGQWHDGLPCPVKEGTPGGRPIPKCYIVTCTVLLFPLLFAITKVFFFFFGFNDFADPNSTAPLRATHLILGYKPISHAFQAPRCVIRAKDPRLHRISVAYEGFVVPEGIPLPRNTPLTQPLPVVTLSARVPSPSPILQVEKEEKKKQEGEGFVDLTESIDEFEVFNQPSPPKNVPEEMGIQRKLQRSL